MPRSLVPANDFGLHGKHILLTRPAEHQVVGEVKDRLVQQLTAWGARVSWLPLVGIQPVPFEWETPEGFEWLFFTSKNAVDYFFGGTKQHEDLQLLKIAVVGPATGQCVQQAGYQPDFISPEYQAESAAKSFCTRFPCAGLRVLWPCGNLANPALTEILQAAGAQVTPLVVYQTLLKPQLSISDQEILNDPVDLLVFTSPSAVEAWAALENQLGIVLPKAPVASLGPRTTQAALQLLGRADAQANPHTLESLAQSIFNYFMEGTLE